MRSDLLSKRLFLVGCLGLPWLWTVHVMNHGNTEENDEGLLNPDDRTYRGISCLIEEIFLCQTTIVAITNSCERYMTAV